MRFLLACLLFAAATGLAQAPAGNSLPAKGACADCGVVSSVRRVKKEVKPSPATEAKPSGLVATVPLGKGGDKPRVGPSQKLGKEAVATSDSWEVTIRLDDGRMRFIVVDEDPGLREGDKVRVEPNGQIKTRTD